MRPLTVVALVLLFAALAGRAYDQALAGEPALGATHSAPTAERAAARGSFGYPAAYDASVSSAERTLEQASPAGTTHVSVWIRMADCESGDGDGKPPYRATWTYNGLHDGGLQFVPSTWNAAKRLSEVRRFAARYGYAYHAPAWVQIRVADNWRRHTSWAQWPTCSRKLGLR